MPSRYYRAVLLTLPIRDVQPATPRARIVRLDLDGQPFEYDAGQAVFVGTHGGARRKPYSIAAAPEDARRDRWLELLVGVEADGTPGAHLALDAGVQVDVEGPVGSFTFPAAPDERRFVFIAGGTGIAPLRSMIRHAVLSRLPGRICLLYSARTPKDFAYLAELRGMARRGEISLSVTATREMLPRWRGGHGRIVAAQLSALVEHPETLCFVCGPASMVADVPLMLRELGIDRTRIRLEDW